jgi:DNA-directed RNA polymerase specialized sigma24 family protein/ribosome-associated translation inhibitor RaiA
MNIHISYKAGKSPEIEHEFQIQLHKLERRLQVYRPDLVHFHAIVDKENGQGATTSLNLRLPSGQMAVQQTAGTILQAVKSAFGDLVTQVTRHKDQLRGSWSWKGRRRLNGVDATPASQRIAGSAGGVKPAPENPDVALWINANLARLEKFIDRELRYRLSIGEFREDQITREEVVDEVVVCALSAQEENEFGAGEKQLERRSLESRLYRLALLVIRGLVLSTADTAAVSLDAPAGVPNVTGSDENHLQFHQTDDALPEESVIADQSVRTPEDIFADEELITQLDRVLRGVTIEDREAFVLFVLEGFTVEEIARIAGHPPEQVRKSIHHARDVVRRTLHTADEFRRCLLQRSKVA